MTHTSYRFVIGILLLGFLYFDLSYFIGGLIVVLFLEGITNLRIPRLITRLRTRLGVPSKQAIVAPAPTGFEAERGMSLLVGAMLLLGYFLLNPILWFLSWFVGFALVGSGVSGFCPMLITLKWLGLK